MSPVVLMLIKAEIIHSFVLPAVAYGSTYYMDDKEGRQQFYYSFAVSMTSNNLPPDYYESSVYDKF
ncbi:hypothetical protein [Psychrobacter glacincola]|uniref:hypothetical protein n=1 Tax=Psychrobacter glacincola TaxID=56810 RepID=UPI0039B0F5DF